MPCHLCPAVIVVDLTRVCPFKCQEAIYVIMQTFVDKRARYYHLEKCQDKARAQLMDDGLDAEEAEEAVDPPPMPDHLFSQDSYRYDSDEDRETHPFLFKKCVVTLTRLSFLERAVRKGFTNFAKSCGKWYGRHSPYQ